MIQINGYTIPFKTFPNGESMLDIKSEQFTEAISQAQKLTEEISETTVVFKFETNVDFFNLVLLKDYLDALYIKAPILTLKILYMPYSRMDRQSDDYAFSLRSAAKLINSCNFNRVKVFEPHSDVTPALINNVETINLTQRIFDNFKIANADMNFAVCFPDAGAQKRYGFAVDKQTTFAVGSKARDFESGEIISYKMNPHTPYTQQSLLPEASPFENVVIIDDLCSKGGTFVYAANELVKLGAKNIYLIVAHCENNINNGLITNDDRFKEVHTSNSILSQATPELQKKLRMTPIWK